MLYPTTIGTLWAVTTDNKGKVPYLLKRSRWTSKIEVEQAIYKYELFRHKLRRAYNKNRLNYWLKTGKRWRSKNPS